MSAERAVPPEASSDVPPAAPPSAPAPAPKPRPRRDVDELELLEGAAEISPYGGSGIDPYAS